MCPSHTVSFLSRAGEHWLSVWAAGWAWVATHLTWCLTLLVRLTAPHLFCGRVLRVPGGLLLVSQSQLGSEVQGRLMVGSRIPAGKELTLSLISILSGSSAPWFKGRFTLQFHADLTCDLACHFTFLWVSVQ